MEDRSRSLLKSIVSTQGGAGECAATLGSEPTVRDRATHVRYYVLSLSFLMAFMMYMELGAIGVAAPAIMRVFHISKIRMGWSVSALNRSYAIFQVQRG